MNEADLIARIAARCPTEGPEVPLGDDAAVAAGVVATVDALVEDQDFRLAWGRPEELGYKCAAVSLSDVAAMGARPTGLLFTLCLPVPVDLAWVDAVAAGLGRCLRAHGVVLLGGDLSRTTGPRVLHSVALGRAVGPPVLRGRCPPGACLTVTGTLGDARAGLERLETGRADGGRLVRAQLAPEPRVREGLALAPLALSMMDLSDGLARDLPRLLGAAGADVELDALPLSLELCHHAGDNAWHTAALGGEDFELLACLPEERLAEARHAVAPTPLTVIGRASAVPGVRYRRGGTEVHLAPGFDHFGADR